MPVTCVPLPLIKRGAGETGLLDILVEDAQSRGQNERPVIGDGRTLADEAPFTNPPLTELGDFAGMLIVEMSLAKPIDTFCLT